MAQPQQSSYPMPPRSFSPPQPANSPGSQPQYPFPPNKRQRLSPNPNPSSQPGSPYVQSPYAMSPAPATPAVTPSPSFAHIQIPPNVYNTPYTNGGSGMSSSPGLTLPQSQPNQQAFAHQSTGPLAFPGQPQANQQPNYNNYPFPQQGPGTMGPPSKPVEKPKEDGQDVMDVFSGTGIDLREEEQYTFQMYSGSSFSSQVTGSQSGTISSGHSYTQFPPGDEASFYGAGPANASAERPNTKSQEEFHQKAADKAWHDAAHDLAISRQKELNNPFLNVGYIHARMQKIARDNGLNLYENPHGQMGTMKLPEHFPKRDVKVQTSIGQDTAFTTTSGNFLPSDSMAVDQLALLSIATKHRLRGLISDASRLAKGRQTGSHGAIPAEWVDAAAPSTPGGSSLVVEGALRSGWESAVSPLSYPRKRSFSVATKTPTSAKPQAGTSQFTNEVTMALRTSAQKERDIEEARLQKRKDRAAGDIGTSRAGSVVPGTPGAAAPDFPEKAPTKKEAKKKADAKVNEAASHAAANQTTHQFLGGGNSLFGKKKKNYSWMTATPGGGGSGASTPGRLQTQGLSGMSAASPAPEKLTSEMVRRLGAWREDKEKGAGIQLRDWITVLEEDGHEKRALQKAYCILDISEPK